MLDALQGGETLSRLSGLRVLNVNGSFFINSEQLETADVNGADALAATPSSAKAELGEALNNPAFVDELTGLINRGYLVLRREQQAAFSQPKRRYVQTSILHAFQ